MSWDRPWKRTDGKRQSARTDGYIRTSPSVSHMHVRQQTGLNKYPRHHKDNKNTVLTFCSRQLIIYRIRSSHTLISDRHGPWPFLLFLHTKSTLFIRPKPTAIFTAMEKSISHHLFPQQWKPQSAKQLSCLTADVLPW